MENKPKEKVAFVTLQHIGKVRQFTVKRAQVLKVHRGTLTINHPRFGDNLVLTPGCIIDATLDLAKVLKTYPKDFQKYGIGNLG